MNIKYKKITATTSIIAAEVMNSFFAVKNFCRTQTGLSTTNATRLPNHRKNQTRIGLLS